MSLPRRRLEPVLFISDAHRPYHDQRAWDLVLKVGQDLKPHTIVTMGDFADFYSVSSHSKDPNRANRLDEEIVVVRAGLAQLEALKPQRKIFLEGNHCDRLNRFLQDRAPELYSVVNLNTLLKLKDHNWELVPYRSDIKLGKVYLTHDVGVAGRNAVFRCADAYQHSVITGHTHRLAYIVEGDATGKTKLSAMFGWLGDVSKADYMHRVKATRDWALGFGIGYLDTKSGNLHTTPVPIINYSCVVNGKLYGS